MEKKIVVSIDPFNIQRGVVSYAEELARASGRELMILSVQGAPILAEPDADYKPHLPGQLPAHIEEAEQMSRSFYEEVKARYPYTTFEHGLGFTASAIIDRLKEMADEKTGRANCLLVMAKTHGHNWWNEITGTVETAVAAAAPCPVLFVPEDVEFNGIKRVMYLTDMPSVVNGEYPGFKFLQSFAASFTADLVVGFMSNPSDLADEIVNQDELMDKLRAMLPLQFTKEYRLFPRQSAEEVLHLAEITNTDIVAFPYRESGILKRFIENEITRALVLKADMPVLVF